MIRNILRKSVVLLAAAIIGASATEARKLVILTTNDTHSQILPDADNLGGVMRRMALIDSVRSANEDVLLIDAGDAVQGTLFFNIGGGRAEEELMNAMGYDLRILGNHEFDNGADSLATILSASKAKLLATNYDLTGSRLDSLFDKYAIIPVADRRIGFMGINLSPRGMIAEGNYDGVRYIDAISAANATARYLKQVEGADYVVAITHIGYDPSMPPGDLALARESTDIDLIIGGHTHTTVNPADSASWLMANSTGRLIPVTQAGKRGHNLGLITIDLPTLATDYQLLPVDSRLDNRHYPEIEKIIKPYTIGIDSLMNRRIATSAMNFDKDEQPLLNYVADYMVTRGNQLADGVELGIINKGGLRTSLPKGDITEGMIIMMMPFNNYTTVLDISGADLLATFDVMARTAGNGVSDNVSVIYDPATRKCVSATIDGKPVDPNRIYRLATIDYLANGGDYMEPLRNGKVVKRSDKVLYRDIINYLEHETAGKKMRASDHRRVKPVK